MPTTSQPKACPFGQKVGGVRPKFSIVDEETGLKGQCLPKSADAKKIVMNCFEDGDEKTESLLKLADMKKKAAEAKKSREDPTK